MTGFTSLIPVHLFRGAEIQSVSVGASSLQFLLDGNRALLLDYYGALEDKDDWLYNLTLCGQDSVQSLVGQKIEICIKSIDKAVVTFSSGKTLEIMHDDINSELMRLFIGDEEYIA